ncbi:MAG: glycosyltransferase [Candidatus Rokubacteria bacterium]|nr:glycosyltransferase [Candidatus Rokubacteria bacterium]
MARRLALLTPFAFPSVRGNAVTVERIARGLRAWGADIEVWDLSTMARASIERRASEYRPELIHAFHAYRTGPLGLALARRIGCPLIVTLTGTDANLDLFDAERAPAVRQVLESAAAVTAFHDSVAVLVARAVPEISARIVVVPQSVDLHDPSPPDGPAPRARGPVMLFPAGIRPVKRPLFGTRASSSAISAPSWTSARARRFSALWTAGRGRATWARCRTRPCPHYSRTPTSSSTARCRRAAWPTPSSRPSPAAAPCSPPTSRATAP